MTVMVFNGLDLFDACPISQAFKYGGKVFPEPDRQPDSPKSDWRHDYY